MILLKKTNLILLSGFLGSGKTTLMLAAADHLRANGFNVACVTNDQGSQLVDSKMVLKKELPLAQIQGGCFCCRFEDLVDAMTQIIEDHQPDVILAEAVGSCTDLIATVVKPLLKFHGDHLDVRPLTVIVDPIRLSESISGSSALTSEITYLFNKQLEEAQCILLNKIDLFMHKETEVLVNHLMQEYKADILSTSTLQDIGIVDWLQHILYTDRKNLPVLDIDYDIYAEGEAQLGWLNSSFTLRGNVDNTAVLCADLFQQIMECLEAEKAEIAHLKLWAEDEQHSWKMSSVGSARLSRTDVSPSQPWIASDLSLWLNARVHMQHGRLREVIMEIMNKIEEEYQLQVNVERLDCFSPGRPQPTHRMA
jgi:G3E family GTPase